MESTRKRLRIFALLVAMLMALLPIVSAVASDVEVSPTETTENLAGEDANASNDANANANNDANANANNDANANASNDANANANNDANANASNDANANANNDANANVNNDANANANNDANANANNDANANASNDANANANNDVNANASNDANANAGNDANANVNTDANASKEGGNDNTDANASKEGGNDDANADPNKDGSNNDTGADANANKDGSNNDAGADANANKEGGNDDTNADANKEGGNDDTDASTNKEGGNDDTDADANKEDSNKEGTDDIDNDNTDDAVKEEAPILKKGLKAPKLLLGASIGTVTINSVSASSSAVVAGTSITYTVNLVHTTDNYKLLYSWYKDGTQVGSDTYMTGNTVTLTPTQAGNYSLKVQAQNLDITSGSQWQSQGTSPTTYVAASAFAYSALNMNATEITLGNSLMFVPAVSGGSGQYAYSYKMYKGSSEVATVSEADGGSYYTYVPTTAGSYYCVATVRDKVFNQSITQTSSTATVREGLMINSVSASNVLVTPGTAVSFTSNTVGGTGTITYDYYLHKDGGEFSVTTGSTSNVYSFTPASNGDYQLYVEAKDANGVVAYANSSIVKVVSAISVTSVSVNPAKPVISAPATFTANVTGTPSTYFWEIQLGNAVVLTQKTTAKTLTYTPTAVGTYVVKVTATLDYDGQQMKAEGQSGNIVIGSALTLNGVSVSPSTAAYLGNSITFTAETTGGTVNKQYIYRIFKNGTLLATYSSTSKQYVYTPASLGTYKCEVGVKDDDHEYYTYATSEEIDVSMPLKISSVSVSSGKVPLGSSITFTPVVSGGDGSYKYVYCVFDSTKQLTMDSSTASSYTYKPAAPGQYYCTVYVTDKTNNWLHLSSQKVDVINSLAMVTSSLNKSAVYTNESVTATINTVGGAAAYAYRVFDSKGNLVGGLVTTSNTYTFTLANVGTYKVTTQAWDGVAWYSATDLTVTAYNPFKYTTVYMDRLGGTVGDTIHVSTDAANGIPSIKYIFCVFNGSTQLTMDYSSSNSYAYKFTQPGTYRIDVYASDAKGQWIVNSRQGITITGSSPLAITNIGVSKTSASVGDTITYTTSTTGGAKTFIYCVFRNGQQLTMTYSGSTTFNYTVPTGGQYTITVYASDGVSWVNKTASASTSVAGNSFNIVSVKADSTTKKVGDTITFTATPSGGSGTVQYIHCVFRGSTQLTMTYSSSPVFTYKADTAGQYHIDVYGADSSGVWVKASSPEVTVGEDIDKLELYVSTSATDLSVGDIVTINSYPYGGVSPYEYIYCLFREGTQLTMNRGPSNYYMYELNATGTYRVDVYCGDSRGTWIMQQSAVITVH